MSQQLLKIRQPEPVKNPVERSPVKEGTKLSRISWEDIIGLSWIEMEEEY